MFRHKSFSIYSSIIRFVAELGEPEQSIDMQDRTACSYPWIGGIWFGIPRKCTAESGANKTRLTMVTDFASRSF
jgi:hypothetical protein